MTYEGKQEPRFRGTETLHAEALHIYSLTLPYVDPLRVFTLTSCGLATAFLTLAIVAQFTAAVLHVDSTLREPFAVIYVDGPLNMAISSRRFRPIDLLVDRRTTSFRIANLESQSQFRWWRLNITVSIHNHSALHSRLTPCTLATLICCVASCPPSSSLLVIACS